MRAARAKAVSLSEELELLVIMSVKLTNYMKKIIIINKSSIFVVSQCKLNDT